MSSHHVVRDFQEPALIVADGAPCSLALMEQLLEWSPYVVALDEAYPKLVDLGIKVDVWLGDFDNISTEGLAQDHTRVIKMPDQEETDLEKAIGFLADEGASAVNIIWATGRRMDHFLNNMSSIARLKDKLSITMLDDYCRAYALPKKFEKWYPANSLLSIMPLPRAIGVTTRGLKYTLDDAELRLGYRTSSSNCTVKDGMVSVAHESGTLLMIESNED